MLAQRARSGLDEGEDAGLGGRVVRLLGAADERGDGGYPDYGAAWGGLRGHLGGGGVDGVEGAGEVGGEVGGPEGEGYAGGCGVSGHTLVYTFICVHLYLSRCRPA